MPFIHDRPVTFGDMTWAGTFRGPFLVYDKPIAQGLSGYIH